MTPDQPPYKINYTLTTCQLEYEQDNGEGTWDKLKTFEKEIEYKKRRHQFENRDTTKKTYPAMTLEECKVVLKKWLYIEDGEALDVTFAFAIGEKLPGDPLWLFLIAPPGGCKTELLRAIGGDD